MAPSSTPSVTKNATTKNTPSITNNNDSISDPSKLVENFDSTSTPKPTTVFSGGIITPKPTTELSTLPTLKPVREYNSVTYINLEMEVIQKILNDSEKTYQTGDITVTLEDNVLYISCDKHFVELDTYQTVLKFLQKNNIKIINVQDLYTLRIDSMISCCSYYNIHNIHIHWIKENYDTRYQLRVVMDQDIFSIIFKGICNYDLTTNFY